MNSFENLICILLIMLSVLASIGTIVFSIVDDKFKRIEKQLNKMHENGRL